MRKSTLILILSVVLLSFFLLACTNDWDGMDRSTFTQPTATVAANPYEAEVRQHEEAR